MADSRLAQAMPLTSSVGGGGFVKHYIRDLQVVYPEGTHPSTSMMSFERLFNHAMSIDERSVMVARMRAKLTPRDVRAFITHVVGASGAPGDPPDAKRGRVGGGSADWTALRDREQQWGHVTRGRMTVLRDDAIRRQSLTHAESLEDINIFHRRVAPVLHLGEIMGRPFRQAAIDARGLVVFPLAWGPSLSDELLDLQYCINTEMEPERRARFLALLFANADNPDFNAIIQGAARHTREMHAQPGYRSENLLEHRAVARDRMLLAQHGINEEIKWRDNVVVTLEPTEVSDEEDSDACTKCGLRPGTCTLMPCEHAGYCEPCIQELARAPGDSCRCPECDTLIESYTCLKSIADVPAAATVVVVEPPAPAPATVVVVEAPRRAYHKGSSALCRRCTKRRATCLPTGCGCIVYCETCIQSLIRFVPDIKCPNCRKAPLVPYVCVTYAGVRPPDNPLYEEDGLIPDAGAAM